MVDSVSTQFCNDGNMLTHAASTASDQNSESLPRRFPSR